MSNVVVREIDVRDDNALHGWWQTSHAAHQGRPIDMYPPWEQSRESRQLESPENDQVLLGAYDGDDLLGSAVLVLPLLGNTGSAFADVTVLPASRRRGVGSALLGRIEEISRARGRRYLIGGAVTPPGGSSAGLEFARAAGFDVVNREGLKALDLDDHPDWSPLDARVAERIGGYRIVQWQDRTPDEHVEGLCVALSSFLGMVPTGELALEDSEWTPQRLRDNEARSARLGRRVFAAAGIAPDGTLAAYTDCSVEAARPTRATIDVTFALPEHRGHSLGLAVKLANHRSLRAAVAECRTVLTDNADTNVHMNAVNDAMGYRLVEDLHEVQKELP